MSINKPRTSNNRKKSEESSENRRQLFIDWDQAFTSPKSTLAWGMFFILLALLLEVSFASHIFTGLTDQSVVDGLSQLSIRDAGKQTRNVLGVLGATISHIFVYRWFGLGSLLIPILAFVAGWKIAFGKELAPIARTTKEVIFFTIWISTLMGYLVMMSGTENNLSFLAGGMGYALNLYLFDWLKWGSIIPIIFSLFVFAVYFYDAKERYEAWVEKNREKEAETLANPAAEAAESTTESTSANKEYQSIVDQTYDDEPPLVNLETEEEADKSEPLTSDSEDTELEDRDDEVKEEPVSEPSAGTNQADDEFMDPPTLTAIPSKKKDVELQLELEMENTPVTLPLSQHPVEEEDANASILREFGQYDPTLDLPQYQFPGTDLLNDAVDNQEKVTQEELESNKIRIVETLGSYGINISKIKATIGPTVTLYEIIPEAGVRISKIKNLEGDIALSLAALGIRIIAPMPGRGTIGIEVPNKNRETVFIHSVLSNERFQKSTYDLPVILGKTISNEIHIADLAKMPHLLMAGATGQGKSVGLNVILASLIYKKHPAELKFVLVDPKKVELTLFNKLERHFLAKLPNSEEAIITDTKKVIFTLNSLCIEMDNRYDLLKEAAVRNLKEYNAKFAQRRLSPEKGHKFLPYIVLVIDELADLMMTAGKEVETPIARLAQLARAVGIHLVVATQRPSVKVITGLIKANFPARLSFRVTSSIDSRTILDAGGAEQLVGQGDMLLSINSEVIRLQCPFIDTREIEDVCDFIGTQRGYSDAYALPEYEDEDGSDGKGEINTDDFDALLPEAARLIVNHQQGSTSLIQRKMKLGYNRAGRIMDQLEMIGVVGPFTGSKARDVMFHDLSGLEEHLRVMGIS
ncbi:DNA translocase FtsK [Dyadobacter tibetensis]|uniref:DNA translocase FtsK n=1 Tax=Dyadobacter tibetensis TaxID=1211851 RepID=UPI0004B1AA23|nr:DNA translocase FtsK [Dyadobacter tibetensis]